MAPPLHSLLSCPLGSLAKQLSPSKQGVYNSQSWPTTSASSIAWIKGHAWDKRNEKYSDDNTPGVPISENIHNLETISPVPVHQGESPEMRNARLLPSKTIARKRANLGPPTFSRKRLVLVSLADDILLASIHIRTGVPTASYRFVILQPRASQKKRSDERERWRGTPAEVIHASSGRRRGFPPSLSPLFSRGRGRSRCVPTETVRVPCGDDIRLRKINNGQREKRGAT